MRRLAPVSVVLVAAACGGRVSIEPLALDASRDATTARDAVADAPLDASAPDMRLDDDATFDAASDDARSDEDAGAMDAGSVEDDAAIGRDASRADAGMCLAPEIGQPCASTCADGLVCDDGACRAPCAEDGSCCAGPGIGCTEATEPGASVCTEGCALVDDPVCGEGLGCRFFHPDASVDVWTFCGAVDSRARDGDPCTSSDQCPRGGTCVGAGYCVTFCRSEAGSCGDDRTCLNFLPHARVGAIEHGYCSSRCTFVPDEGCVAGTTCLPLIDSRFGPATYYAQCRRLGPGQDGDACATYADCGAGRLCLEGACRTLCLVDRPDCPAASACRSLSPVLETAAGEVGFCGL